MAINATKSACLRIGPHYQTECANIVTINGSVLKWTDSIRYLGVYVTTANCFKCVFENAKRTFYKSANNIFGKVGRVASEEVVLRLIQSKCMPCMLY